MQSDHVRTGSPNIVGGPCPNHPQGGRATLVEALATRHAPPHPKIRLNATNLSDQGRHVDPPAMVSRL